MKKSLFCSALFILAGALAYAEGIVVVQPAGGEAWPLGFTQEIRWQFSPGVSVQPVNIVLFKGFTTVGVIARGVESKPDGSGYFKWVVGNLLPANKYVLEPVKTAPPGKDYHIGIKVPNTAINGESQAFIIQ